MILLYLILAACLAVGAILCFKGKDFTFFALGAVVSLYCRYTWPEYFPEGTWGVLALVILAVLVGGLIHKLYHFGMFLAGALLGAAVGMMLLGAMPELEAYHWAVIGGCAIAVGLFAAFVSDWFVVVATAFGGAVFIVLPLTFLVVEWGAMDAFLGDGLLETAKNLTSVLNHEYLDAQGVLPAVGIALFGLAGTVAQKK